MNTEPDIIDSPAAKEKNLHIKKGKIEFKNVFFKYHTDGSEYVLKDINLIVQPGETIAIIGATGSSKSTLVQLIPRLYNVTNGAILIDDVNIQDYTLQNLRTGISLVLQQNELFSGTIKQNLKWGQYISFRRSNYCCCKRCTGTHDFIMSFPKQYETVLGQSGVNVFRRTKATALFGKSYFK